MNTSSVDALVGATLNGSVPPAPASLSPSLTAAGSDPNLAAAAAMFHRSSTMPVTQVPQAPKSNNHAIYLSILNEQRRRSMNDLNGPASKAAIIGRSAHMRAYSADGLAPNPTQASSGVSAASDHASLMQTRFDSTVTAPSRRRKPNFAEKLHAVLTNKECRRAVAWLPSGRSFCISDQDEFVKRILPKFFREAKFESFSRRLKRWGFRKVYTTGLSQVVFSHDLFHRDRPDLCRIMNGREKVGANDSQHQPQAQAAGQFAPQAPRAQAQGQQYRNTMMLQQAPQPQYRQAFQQRAMLAAFGRQNSGLSATSSSPIPSAGSLGNAMPRGVTASPAESRIDTHAVLREARVIMMSRSMPMPSVAKDPVQAISDQGSMREAEMQLTRLNDDIANCEEQLAILQKLKELKEKRRILTGGACTSPRGVSPSSC